MMCGMGHTGRMHAWEHHGVKPDIQACGKGLSGGYVPVSAVLVSDKVVRALQTGSGAFNNGHTYQSSSLGCRAGVEVQKIFKKEKLVERCNELGKKLEEALRTELGSHVHVGDIRGQGLFWLIELVEDKATKKPFPASLPLANMINDECIRRGIVLYPGKGTIDGTFGDHILTSPPYTVTEDEVLTIARTLRESVD